MPRSLPLRDHVSLDALAEVPFFGSLSRDGLEAIYESLELTSVRGGEVVYRRGDPGGSFSVVLHGRLVSVEGDLVVQELTRSDCLGEISFLMEEPHTRTILASRDSLLASLARDRFHWLLEREPRALLELSRRLIALSRRRSRLRPGDRMTTFAVLPASRGVDLAGFSRALVQALGVHGRVAWLAPDPHGDLDPEARIPWLYRQEREHDYIVYQAEPAASAWTSVCVRQADCLLLVGEAGEEPWFDVVAADLAREEAAKRQVRQELVLLQRGAEISGTARWLDAWPVPRHHHVRTPADLDRAARLLTGRAVGLVLGGGGARGFAHIGVLRALHEAGIPVDRLGGTSVGSILSTMIARGEPWQALVELARRQFSDYHKLYDFTIPFVAVLKGQKVHHLMDEVFGDLAIEDLPIEMFCVATNLTRAEPVMHRRGSVVRAILQSITVPGVAPLPEENGQLFCDGGLVDNLPVDVMAGLGPGPIISVDVSSVEEAPPPREPGMLARLLHLHHPAEGADLCQPNIVDVLMRTVYVGANYAQRFRQHVADLVLEPPVTHYGVTDWHAVDEFVEIGYRHAQERLETWQGRPRPAVLTPP